MNVKKRLNTKECTLVDTFKESRGCTSQHILDTKL